MFSVGKSDVGIVRSNNEDFIFVTDEPIGSLPNLFVVADGMGGHNGGEVASRTAVESFLEYLKSNENKSADVLDFLISAAGHANKFVFDMSESDPSLNGMGTTFSACVIAGNKMYTVHIGDSRVYSVSGGKLTQVTNDHTFVCEMVKSGQITAEQAKTHPKRNVLMKVLGIGTELMMDGIITAVGEGDKILLCTDGLTNMLSDANIFEIISDAPDCDEAASRLVAGANANGGCDNISLILIDLR